MAADTGQIQATPGDLSAAGGVIGGAATTLTSVAGNLSSCTITSPGFQTAAQLTSCCSNWGSALSVAATAVNTMSTDLNLSASKYQQNEADLSKPSSTLVTS